MCELQNADTRQTTSTTSASEPMPPSHFERAATLLDTSVTPSPAGSGRSGSTMLETGGVNIAPLLDVDSLAYRPGSAAM